MSNGDAEAVENIERLCRKWVVFDPGPDAPDLLPAGSEFLIEAIGGGSYRFVPLSGGTLTECELTPVTGQGGFKAGVRLPGALRGDFPGIGPVDFSLTKLGSNRFVISVHLPHDEISAMVIKHGGPHGVDD